MKTKRNRPSYAAVLAASDAALLAAYKRDRLSDAKWAALAALPNQVIDMVAFDAACNAYDAACDAAADASDRSCDVADAYAAARDADLLRYSLHDDNA